MSVGIKTERMLVLKRAVILMCDLHPIDPEGFLSEVMYTIEKKFIKKEMALCQCIQAADVRDFIKNAVDRHPILGALSEKQRTVAINLFAPMEISATATVRQDDLRENFYVVCDGELDVLRNDDSVVRILKKGDTFGSLNGRTYISDDTIVRAKETSKVWYMTQCHMFHVIADYTGWKRSIYVDGLGVEFKDKEKFCGKEKKRVLLPFADPTVSYSYTCACCTNSGGVSDKPTHYYGLESGVPPNLFGPDNILPGPPLLKCIDRVQFAPGHTVIKQGQNSRNFYYIIHGEASVFYKYNADEEEREVCTLKPKDHFGENGFLLNRKAPSTVKAKNELFCMRLQPYLFEQSLSEFFDFKDELPTTSKAENLNNAIG